MVTYRKVSDGSRSPKGTDDFLRVYMLMEAYRRKEEFKAILNSIPQTAEVMHEEYKPIFFKELVQILLSDADI